MTSTPPENLDPSQDTTDYLFASPENARRLRDTDEAVERGQSEEHELDDDAIEERRALIDRLAGSLADLYDHPDAITIEQLHEEWLD